MRPAAAALLLLRPAAAATDAAVVLPLTRRHALGQGQRRRLEQVDEARLFGDLYDLMSYHVDVLVGTPGQLQSLIVDTGSGVTAFPCTDCGAGCGQHIDQPFNPANSSSFRWLGCGEPYCKLCGDGGRCAYRVRYVEGSSIEGQFFEDVLHLGHLARHNRLAPVWLGCHVKETGYFRDQVPSGIMGAAESSWDVLTALVGGSINKRILGLCLSDRGGVMTLGGANQSWTPIEGPLQSVAYGPSYTVVVTDATLAVAGKASIPLTALSGTYALDSGTTFTYFSRQQAAELRSALRAACDGGACGSASPSSETCWTASDEDIDKFPSLKMQMGHAIYVWGPRGYLSSQSGKMWCYTFHGEPPLTLGAAFMRHHLVIFDSEERSVSFAPSSCPTITSRSDVVQLHGPVLNGTPVPLDLRASEEGVQASSSRGRPTAVFPLLSPLLSCLFCLGPAAWA